MNRVNIRPNKKVNFNCALVIFYRSGVMSSKTKLPDCEIEFWYLRKIGWVGDLGHEQIFDLGSNFYLFHTYSVDLSKYLWKLFDILLFLALILFLFALIQQQLNSTLTCFSAIQVTMSYVVLSLSMIHAHFCWFYFKFRVISEQIFHFF